MMRRFFMPVLALLCAALLCSGCAKGVSKTELELVNEFLVQSGAIEINPEDAADMNEPTMKNMETGETVSSWQLLADYVRCLNNGNEPPSSYSVEAGPGSTVGFDMDGGVWERIHMGPSY